jgi:hypothetical protein
VSKCESLKDELGREQYVLNHEQLNHKHCVTYVQSVYVKPLSKAVSN